MAPPTDDPPVAHAAPSSLSGATTTLGDVNVLDVSTDQGGGIWAVSESTVYYFPPGATQPITYDQSKGLARGWHTWQDPYYNGTPQSPATLPITFSAVAGATAGQAIVGNMGAIGDRLTVDPKTGAVQGVENLAITHKTTRDDFYEDHLVRVVATHKIITVLDGVLNGSAYIGHTHGFSALHGLKGDCGCKSDFDEHQHYVGCDSSGGSHGCWDGDVWGLAMSPQGEVWAGDRHFVQLLAQNGVGPNSNIMEQHFVTAFDVFPDLLDEVHGLAVDSAGGVWVASDGNGLAYIAPGEPVPTYWSAATTLPKNHLRGAAVDPEGDLWIGTDGAGVARFDVAHDRWSYYTAAASGLPDDQVNTIYVDQFSKTRRIFIATHKGFTVYQGQ